MASQNLIVALLVVTLIVNVILGIELYTVLHQSSHTVGSVSLNTSTFTLVSNSSTSSASNNTSLYKFSYVYEIKIHIKHKGEYVIGIKPNNVFKSVYVLIYLDDGQTISLSLSNPYANITINSHEVKLRIYVYGESYDNLTPSQVLQNLNLYLNFISSYDED